jgi:hypothetical protein
MPEPIKLSEKDKVELPKPQVPEVKKESLTSSNIKEDYFDSLLKRTNATSKS